MKQAYFFDIDGTLYDNRFHEIHPALQNELRHLLDTGNDVYLLSSRSVYETVHLPESFRETGFTGIIVDGGASVYDGSWNLQKTSPIDSGLIELLKHYCRENSLNWRWSGPEGDCFENEPDQRHRQMWKALYLMVPETRSWSGEEICNILVFTSDPQQIEEISQIFKGSSIVVYSDCIEIRQAGVSKECWIDKARESGQYGKIICAGDGMNDVAMLEKADYAIAVENACQPAKDQADEIVSSPAKGGVALWLSSRRNGKESVSNEYTTED